MKKIPLVGIPQRSVDRTPCFHCRDTGSIPGLEKYPLACSSKNVLNKGKKIPLVDANPEFETFKIIGPPEASFLHSHCDRTQVPFANFRLTQWLGQGRGIGVGEEGLIFSSIS